MKKVAVALHLTFAIMLIITPVAFAEEDEPVEVEFTGTVTAIDLDGGTLTLEAEDGESFIILPPEGFDLSPVEIGDLYEIEGILAGDGSVLANKLKLEDEDRDESDSEPENDDHDKDAETEGGEGSFFCRAEAEMQHPFASALAETYAADAEQIMRWFCEGKMGFGQIMLALQTAKMKNMDAGELIARRKGGASWGKIWVDMAIIGKDREAHPPMRPDHAGPPDHTGRPEEKGPPPGQDH